MYREMVHNLQSGNTGTADATWVFMCGVVFLKIYEYKHFVALQLVSVSKHCPQTLNGSFNVPACSPQYF